MIPFFSALTIALASIAPSIASVIMRLASDRFLPHETAPETARASTVYPPISFSASKTHLNEPYFVFILMIFFNIYLILAWEKLLFNEQKNGFLPMAQPLIDYLLPDTKL